MVIMILEVNHLRFLYMQLYVYVLECVYTIRA